MVKLTLQGFDETSFHLDEHCETMKFGLHNTLRSYKGTMCPLNGCTNHYRTYAFHSTARSQLSSVEDMIHPQITVSSLGLPGQVGRAPCLDPSAHWTELISRVSLIQGWDPCRSERKWALNSSV